MNTILQPTIHYLCIPMVYHVQIEASLFGNVRERCRFLWLFLKLDGNPAV